MSPSRLRQLWRSLVYSITAGARWMVSGGGTLKERAARGGLWLLACDILVRSAGTLKSVVVARLLAPADFGLMGIANAMLQCIGYFTETGLQTALTQKQGDIRPYLDSVWCIQAIRGLLAAAALAAAAPVAAQFFNAPESVNVIRAAAAAIAINGFAGPAAVFLQREMAFQRDTVIRAAGPIAGLLVAIPVALVYRNVWALVISVLVARVVEVAASYWAWPYRPRLRLDWGRSRELMRFGRWVSGFYVMMFCELYIDTILVGRVLGTTALGFYQMAAQLALLPFMQLGLHVHAVLFPALSKIQEAERQGKALTVALRLVSAALVPPAFCVSLFSVPLIQLLLGSKWLPVAPLITIMVWGGVARALSRVVLPLFLATARPHLSLYTSALNVALLAGLAYPLMVWGGLAGIAWAVAVSSIVSTVCQLVIAARLAQVQLAALGAALVPGAWGCGLFAAARVIAPSGSGAWPLAPAAVAAAGYAVITLAVVRQLRPNPQSPA